MAIMNQAFVDGAHAVVRAAELHARQAVSSVVSSTESIASPTTITSVVASASSTSIFSSSPPITSGSPSPSPAPNNNNGGTNSPLLFFVALGFGVVFTNLWIIVGVKYCFRYNARNRQLRGAVDENGEPINLENMPARPHRRRREKKLMTMDEVNEKFPMMKYKAWVADRAKDGLPTAGGVAAAPSRASSVRDVDGVVPELPPKERQSTDNQTENTTEVKTEPRPDSSTAAKPADDQQKTPSSTSGSGAADEGTALAATHTAPSVATKDPDHHHGSDDDDDDDDHINAAIPPELLTTAGDTCAICIDTLEDDDDVRGLTCGHAFHAVCLDPWLTNRRACCPLCKADYYTPKPRPPPADGSDPLSPTATNGADPARNNGRLNLPLAPQRTFGGWGLRSSRAAFRARNGGQQASNETEPRPSRTWEGRRRQHQESANQTPAEGQDQGLLARFRNRFAPFGTAQPATPAADTSGTGNTATATPSQLEAGTRSATR